MLRECKTWFKFVRQFRQQKLGILPHGVVYFAFNCSTDYFYIYFFP